MNWFDMAKQAHDGGTPELTAAASFASTLFARLVSIGFFFGKADWWHARIGTALLTVFFAGVVYVLFARSGRRAAGAAMVAWQLLSPWSLAWSRTISMSYALMSGLGAIGTLVWWLSLDARSPRRRAIGLVVASQIFVVDLFLSPFALVPIAAAAAVLVMHPHRRALVRSPGPWIAAILMAAEAVPMGRAASNVAGLHGYTLAQILGDFGPRAVNFARALVDGVDGAATIQHFAWGRCESPGLSLATLIVGRIITVLLCGLLVHAIFSKAVRAADPWAVRAGTMFVVGLVVTPVLLAPARDWAMPTIDSDRYAFAWAMPLGLVLALAAERSSALVKVVRAAFAFWLFIPSVTLLFLVWHGPGKDCGIARDDGGAWRGWRITEGAQALPEWLAEATIKESGGAPSTLVIDDFFGLRAVAVSLRMRASTIPVVFPEHASGGEPLLPKGRLLLALWPPSLFVPGQPAGSEESSLKLRALVIERGGHLLRTGKQPNGDPLIELWTLEVP